MGLSQLNSQKMFTFFKVFIFGIKKSVQKCTYSSQKTWRLPDCTTTSKKADYCHNASQNKEHYKGGHIVLSHFIEVEVVLGVPPQVRRQTQNNDSQELTKITKYSQLLIQSSVNKQLFYDMIWVYHNITVYTKQRKTKNIFSKFFNQ